MLPLSLAKVLAPQTNVLLAIVSGALGYALLEFILQVDRHAALAAAFMLHILITFSSLPNARSFLLSGKIPLAWNVLIVVQSYLYSLFKSYAMRYLPMSVFLTGSNMQLVVAVIVGKVIFSSVYTTGQINGVLLVVIGCIITTLLSSDIDNDTSMSEMNLLTSDFFIGIVCMVLMLLTIAALMPTVGHVIKKYHADSDEQLFMQHSLALPLFALQWSNLLPSLNMFHTEIGKTGFLIYGHPIPLLFIMLVASAVFTQINRTTSACITLRLGSLTTQLVATLTKTLSTLMSFFIFNCNFSGSAAALILLGIFLQTVGSVVYAVNSPTVSNNNNMNTDKIKSQ